MKPLSELKHLLPENPEGMADGHFQTMNNTGSCEDFLDELTQAFVDYSKDKTVIDIGCGYGTAAIAAAENGAKIVLAADVEFCHNKILKKRVEGDLKIQTILCDFLTGEMDSENFTNKLFLNAFGAALLNKVIHLLSPEECVIGLNNIYRMLKNGGKLFIKAMTPYLKCFDPFDPRFVFMTNLKHSLGHDFPGYIEDVGIEGLPSKLHLFTTETLEKLLKDVGFHIEELKYIQSVPEEMQGLEEKDYVMAIARK